MSGHRFATDPPPEEGHDPSRCDCGAHLTEYVGPDGETERICPECDADMASLAPPDPTEPRPGPREPYGIGVDGPEVGQGIDAPWLEPGPCPRCGGRQLADGVCADGACDASHLYRGSKLDRY